MSKRGSEKVGRVLKCFKTGFEETLGDKKTTARRTAPLLYIMARGGVVKSLNSGIQVNGDRQP